MEEANIEGDEIVIRIPIDALAHAHDVGVDMGFIFGGSKITDARAFAPELVLALNDEDEEGTTMIHRMLDRAIEKAIEDGAQGVEECDEEGDEEE